MGLRGIKSRNSLLKRLSVIYLPSRRCTVTTGQLTLEELQKRYSITRNPLYSRIKALGIKLGRRKGKSVATPEQIQQLDQIHEHLAAGGTLKTFVPVGEIVVEDSTEQNTAKDSISGNNLEVSDLATAQDSTVQTVQDSTELLLAVIKAMGKQRSPLDAHRDLKEASEEGWLLTTAEIKEIIGVKPVIKPGTNFYQRGNWKFIKAGRIGSQIAWRVQKDDGKT